MFPTAAFKPFVCLMVCVLLVFATGRRKSAADELTQAAAGLPVARLLPDNAFDPSIQTPEQFFGFQLGSRHLLHYQVAAYAKYLADTSPHVRLIPYATSHGQRPLAVLLVTRDADNLDLEQLERQRRLLTSGLSEIDLTQPSKTVAYVGYSVHGDEASGLNAFPAVAYYLAAGADDLRNRTLDRSIILLDPCLNPDGSDRFANWVNDNRGRFPNANDRDREHSQPWPRGRSNFYWFDLNRDWLPTAHPESQGRLEIYHKMKPNVVLDFHEMSSTSSYFFQPGIPARNNPLTPEKVFELTRQFAREHAKAMDDANELYFTEESFDDFYMGKGSTYPDLHGAVGILFEQGSTRGLLSSNDRYTRSFSDTIANQIRTSLSSLQALDVTHDELRRHQADFYSQAMRLAKQTPTTAYVLHAAGDTSRVAAAARLLRRHDIQVSIPETVIQVDGIELASGAALVIPVRQPEYRFIESLMQRTQDFRENIFYDVSAWTLPLAFDLETIDYRSDIPESWIAAANEPTDARLPVDVNQSAADPVAYVIDPVSLDAPKVVAKIMRAGFEVRVAYGEFQAEAGDGEVRAFPRGSWIIAKPTNAKVWDGIVDVLASASEEADVIIASLPSGLLPVGPDLGSDSHKVVPRANVLLVVGEGTISLDAGSIWHFLDHRLELPATLVNTDGLGAIDLQPYTCVILPSGSYSTISSSALSKLENYVAAGGTIVALQSSIEWLQSTGLLPKPESASTDRSKDANMVEPPQRFADAADATALESIAGAIFAVQVDGTHPLGFGLPDETVPVFRDSTSVYQVPKNRLTVAAKYDAVTAGYVSERNRARLADTAAVWAENSGSGRIICIADNPVFRGYFRGSERFLTNAILLGPTLRVPSLTD